MTASTQPTETRAQTTNGSFQTDVSALQETTERQLRIARRICAEREMFDGWGAAVSAQPANDDGVDRGDQQHPVICAAPSCWEEGEAIEIEGDSSRAPILCELHRRCYLGVST
jgi:hypothetical protein